MPPPDTPKDPSGQPSEPQPSAPSQQPLAGSHAVQLSAEGAREQAGPQTSDLSEAQTQPGLGEARQASEADTSRQPGRAAVDQRPQPSAAMLAETSGSRQDRAELHSQATSAPEAEQQAQHQHQHQYQPSDPQAGSTGASDQQPQPAQHETVSSSPQAGTSSASWQQGRDNTGGAASLETREPQAQLSSELQPQQSMTVKSSTSADAGSRQYAEVCAMLIMCWCTRLRCMPRLLGLRWTHAAMPTSCHDRVHAPDQLPVAAGSQAELDKVHQLCQGQMGKPARHAWLQAIQSVVAGDTLDSLPATGATPTPM